MKGVTELGLFQTGVTDAGLATLRKRLPRVRVKR